MPTNEDLELRLQALERSQEVKLYRIGQAERMEERLQGRLERMDSEFKKEVREYSEAREHGFNEFTKNQTARTDAQDRRIDRIQNSIYLFALGILAFAGSILYVVSQHH